MATNNLKYFCAFLVISLLLILANCSLEKIDPSVKYDPCLGKVKAIFTHNKVGISCDSPCIVQFSNTSTGGKTYLWDFKDGTTTTEKEPNHTFKKSANVTLFVFGENGCQDSTSVDVTVVSNVACNKPKPDFDIFFPNGQTVPVSVKFNNMTTNSNTFQWYIIDGVDTIFKSNTASPQFDFTVATSYQIILVAKNSCGTKSLSKTMSLKTITFSKIFESAGLRNVDFGKWVSIAPEGSQQYLITGTYAFYGSSSPTPNIWLISTDKNGNKISDTRPRGTQFNPFQEFGNVVFQEIRRPGGVGLTIFGTTYMNSVQRAVSVFWLSSPSTGGGPSPTEFSTSESMVTCNYGQRLSDGGSYIICGKNVLNQISLAKTYNNIFTLIPMWSGTTLGEAFCVRQTLDNGFITSGISSNSFYLLKTDAN